MRVTRAGIVHLNTGYVRGDDGLDLRQLFTFADLTREARAARPVVIANLRRWRRQLRALAAPAIAPGVHCHEPYACPFTDHCIPDPGPYSLLRIPRGDALLAKLRAGAYDDVRRLPARLKLSPVQERAITCLVAKRDHATAELAAVLSDVTFPLHFLDFETINPAIPRYAGTRPYQAIPFQWSLHTLSASGALTHQQFLHDAATDPRRACADSLLAALGTAGTVAVYSGYEEKVLRSLADALPARAARIEAVVARLFDLLPVMREHYYHPALDGSFSLKALVPAVVPHLAYDGIAAGMEASAAYEELIHPDTPAARAAELRAALLAYCATDTLALHEVRLALLARAAR